MSPTLAWLLDLDGVVWRGDEPIRGSAAAVAEVRSRGERVVFVTNNSSATVAQYLDKLSGCGLPVEAADLVTSAQAAASLVERGATALVCAGPGVVEALEERGVSTVRRGDADTVVVGWHRDFDFDRLTAAFTAVQGGARLVGTNDDATYPVPGGLLPGAGSILAAVAYATGVVPLVAGKPHAAMAALLARRVPDANIMVGDKPETDGAMARALGVPFALVLSGVTTADQLPVDPTPDHLADDLAALVVQRYGV